MTALVLSLTNAGLAAVQAASGSDPVVIAELGLTATPFEVAPTLTALPGEFKRIAAVSGTAAAANITHMTAYDTSSEVWNATGLGLWLADGTLFAVYSAGSTIINKAAVAFALVSFDIAWQADLAASIAFGDPIFTNPPATEAMRGLIELADADEALAGADLLRALTPGRAKAVVLAWLLGLDGAGSGLDADQLDGQHGAWYADIAARLGYTPLNVTAYTAADVLAKLLTVDGAGSGVDADTVDGHHAAAFRRVVSSNITANGGYIEYSDGLKETWGWVDCGANTSATYNVPIGHTTWINPVLGIAVQPGDDNNSENTGLGSIVIGTPTTIEIYSAENFTARVYIQTKGK
jgi:hypothetical protein|nr:MAG TPA: LONG TAIL FIBER PROTEIN [Caudoviricetes sp.]